MTLNTCIQNHTALLWTTDPKDLFNLCSERKPKQLDVKPIALSNETLQQDENDSMAVISSPHLSNDFKSILFYPDQN